MTNPIIGYENTLSDATLTASGEAAGGPKENAINWQLFNYWQPTSATSSYLDFDFTSGRTCDYAAFYSSDFYSITGATFKVYSGASSPPTTEQVSETITTAGPKLFTFTTSSSHRYWRVQFDTTSASQAKIQAVSFGTRLELQRGIRPPFTAPALLSFNQVFNSVSENGIFLGRSLKTKPQKFSIQSDTITPAWVRSNWPALLTHIEQYPFFILPEPDSYTDEAVFAWTDGEIRPPQYNQSSLLSLNLNLMAYSG